MTLAGLVFFFSGRCCVAGGVVASSSSMSFGVYCICVVVCRVFFVQSLVFYPLVSSNCTMLMLEDLLVGWCLLGNE